MLFRKLGFFGICALMGLTIFFFNPALINAQSVTEVATGSPTQINWLQALILGLIQGLTEFLPISSTAHLTVIPQLFGWGKPGVAYIAVIQLGSIAAIIWYFWQDLSQITMGMLKAIRTKDYSSLEFKLALGIGLGTLPIIVLGLFIKIFVPDLDNSPLHSLTTIAIASIVMSLLLALAEKVGTHRRPFEKLRWQDGVVMGFAEAMAIIPGVSRSGSTLTAGLFINLERATAARFSFLLGIPAITLAGLVQLKDAFKAGFSGETVFPLLIGVISAAFFSYLAIAWLLKYLQKNNTWVFIWYRLAFGILILLSSFVKFS
jgi:undecaprenyl-diphosphatase